MDPRIEKLAEILTNYSIKIKEGNQIMIDYGIAAQELALACYKHVLKLGAIPNMRVSIPGQEVALYEFASEKQLQTPPLTAKFEAENADGIIRIVAPENTRELTSSDPHKMALRRKAIFPIKEIMLEKNNWVLFYFPTLALAQDAEMSLEEFENFVYDACLVDWKAEEARQEKLKQALDAGKNVRIVAKNTDLTFSIDNRQGIKCCGKRNMPDGEVFIAPVEDTTEGHIEYSFPAIYGGREVAGVKLTFKNGKVVEATAEKNEKFLKEMIAMDEGASKLGEFGVATNFNIQKHVKQILFDEKIGGSIHLALGMAYKEGNGQNESDLHWDMILDLRQGGYVEIDGKKILEDGTFLL